MKFILSFVVLFFSFSAWSVSMKLEGSCAGKLANGSDVAFQYYSNFNGCTRSAKAAISYEQGREGLTTGTRSFTEKSDIYTFGKTRIVFANLTGNTSGRFHYTDSRGYKKSVTLQCDVRDYEYAECN